MSHFAESSGGGRARSRLQGARSTRIGSEHNVVLDPVGELSGFPLIPCLDCGLARFPKLCGSYRFEKEYFQQLKDRGIIIVCPLNWAELLDEEEGSVDSPNGDTKKKTWSRSWRI
ncbi:unnamed protein product [Miscanthus lutarioriparius]|uniref:Uncharacterized protein n=1 Tax=Miscanthus lutarioriparius TaxID=422564 RepID=A0A811NRL9_9POAL|nr:unnamed protein product [Miscanthus lutarioriparius]